MNIKKILVSAAAITGAVVSTQAIASADTVITVKSGDTVSALAEQYKTTISEIQQLNNLSNPNLIFVGQQLKVQGQKLTNNVNPETQTYDVQSNNNTKTKNTTLQNVKTTVKQNTSIAQTQKQAIKPNNIQSVQNTQSTAKQSVQNTQPTTKQNVQSQEVEQNVQQQNTTSLDTASNDLSNANAAARAWIVAHESGGNYDARNGQYIGKYQLSASYLDGNYSPAHQDEVANQYVSQRYGSWVNAQKHWEAYGWY